MIDYSEAARLEEIAKRPYRVIKAPDGQVLCHPPDLVHGGDGPIAIGGMHPDDWFAVDENGIATRNYE